MFTKVTLASPGRGDIHSPANLDPEAYEYLFSWDSDTPGCLLGIAQSDAWHEWMAARAPIARDRGSSQCSHCGAHIRYVALIRHIPTGETLYVGETCLANRFERSTADFQRLRKAAQLDRAAQRIKKAWEEYRETHEADWEALGDSKNAFVVDVLAKGRKYGNLSDRQLEAIKEAIVREAKWAEAEAAFDRFAAPEIPSAPVVEGNGVIITGKVVSRKAVEGDWGWQRKMLVVVTTEAGEYKVWGTEPSSITPEIGDTVTLKIGDTVTLTANVKVSQDDPSFGFFSRPRKATVTPAVTSQV